MAEEKPTPAQKKEKSPRKETAPAPADASAKVETTEKKPAKEKGPKAPAGEKGAKKDAAPAESAAPAAAPAADKPVEMVGGVAKQPTAEDLLKEELGALKIRRPRAPRTSRRASPTFWPRSTTRSSP
jgi:small subunit ribosomal protein S11